MQGEWGGEMISKRYGALTPLETIGRVVIARAQSRRDNDLSECSETLAEEIGETLRDIAPPSRVCFDAPSFYVVGALRPDNASVCTVYHATASLDTAVMHFTHVLGHAAPEPAPEPAAPVYGPVKSLRSTVVAYLHAIGLI